MKMDRLIGITMYLLNRNVVSAKELAERFEVSARTIVRDIESLSIAGIPISSSTGAAGGYEILDTFKLNKQITTMEEDSYNDGKDVDGRTIQRRRTTGVY